MLNHLCLASNELLLSLDKSNFFFRVLRWELPSINTQQDVLMSIQCYNVELKRHTVILFFFCTRPFFVKSFSRKRINFPMCSLQQKTIIWNFWRKKKQLLCFPSFAFKPTTKNHLKLSNRLLYVFKSALCIATKCNTNIGACVDLLDGKRVEIGKKNFHEQTNDRGPVTKEKRVLKYSIYKIE